jgi:hypothetical protein
MTGVMLGQDVVPIGGSGCHGWGPRGSPSSLRVPRAPRARRKYAERIGRFDDVTGARARQKMSSEAPISLETFPQGLGEIVR